MKKLRMLGMMLVLSGVIVATVVLGSPYMPVVQPVMDIEEIWAIEDTRQESDEPLVTALHNRDVPLAYDRESNTFFCTLGMNAGTDWPEIHLHVDGAEDTAVAFVDDYTYDWCRDAIRDSYIYEAIAYNDESYSYFNIVFTSLPLVMLRSGEKIPAHEDTPVELALSWDHDTVMRTHARAHRRGDTSLRKFDKNGIKVEYTRNENGRHKIAMDTPFLGRTQGMLLLACAVDHQMIRDRLCWDMYSGIVEEDAPFGRMKAHYAELFVNDAYQGAYLMLKPYEYETEMAKLEQQAPAKDSYYRVVGRSTFEFDRPVLQDHRKIYYEQHYAPAGMEPFDSLRPYLELIKEPSNAKYSEMVLRYLDIDSIIRYMLFVHACGLTDNDVNNINIWAHQSESGVRYFFNPWDLDVSWGLDDDENTEVLYEIELFNRMVALDCGGVVRDRVKAIWADMREKAFNQEYLNALVAQYEKELNESAAYYRDMMKWEKSTSYLDMYNICSYAAARFEMMDRRVAEMTDEALKGRYLHIGEYETIDLGPLDEAMKQDVEIRNSVL